MENIFANLGIGGIGFFFLWHMMKQSFEKDKLESEKRDKSIDKLCDKIDDMIATIHDMTAKDIQKTVQMAHATDEIKDMYIRQANRIDRMAQSVEAIDIRTKICPVIQKCLEEKGVRLFDEGEK